MKSVRTMVMLSVFAIMSLCIGVAQGQNSRTTQESRIKQEQVVKPLGSKYSTQEASRYERDREDKRSSQRGRVYFFGGLLALFAVTVFFPRFGTFILGPAILIATAWLIFSDQGAARVLFSSGGDGWAGLGRFIAWIGIFFACSLGVAIIMMGRARLKVIESKQMDEDC